MPLEVTAVVALKALQLAVLEAEESIDGPIEEVAVVGDHDDTAAEVLQEILEHGQGLDVEVVGGFVQQQDIGGLDQQATKV